MTEGDEKRPERGDGRGWHPRHVEAAVMRGEGREWSEIAKELDVAEGTARNYTRLDGFDALVEFYTMQVVRARFRAIERENVELVVLGKSAALATLVGAAAEGSVDAAIKFLEAIGFVEKNKALARFQAATSKGENSGPQTVVINRRDLGAEPSDAAGGE